MKALTGSDLEVFLRSLASEYDVRAPIALQDGTRAIRGIDEGPLALEGGRVPSKPASVFFPQFEDIFTAGQDGQITPIARARKPILLIGLTAEDADCLEFTDRFFAANYRDPLYFSKRADAVIVVISGRCGPNGTFLRIARGKCDLELVYDGTAYVVIPYSETGRAIEARMPDGTRSNALETLARESNALPADDRDILEQASSLIRSQQVPDAFWAEIADRCIACTACNLVCPTCTCFEVVDTQRNGTTQRHRLWDSCQLDGFMREASGHNPMGAELLRTRRRIHHKLAADVERWGHMTCFLCGRCDDVCPSGIGMKAVTREIVERFGSEGQPPSATPHVSEAVLAMQGVPTP